MTPPASHVPPFGECFLCFGMRPCDEPEICYPEPVVEDDYEGDSE